jgi:hypothetical protein
MNPTPTDGGVFAVQGTELVLFLGGAVVTVMVLALGIWLFVRASREHRAQEDAERRERNARDGDAR